MIDMTRLLPLVVTSGLSAAIVVAASASLAACGSSSGGASPADAGATSDAGGTADAPSSDSGPSAPTLDERKAAASAASKSDAVCKGIPSFYWEIGDVNGVIVSGAQGNLFGRDSPMAIASASKLVFGAYVVERFKSDLTQVDMNAMRMMSGYVNLIYEHCLGAASVATCFHTAGNDQPEAQEVGYFDYNGGHFQKYAIDLGLGDDDDAKLEADVKSLVGTELAFTYGSPQLAAGIKTSPGDYAVFLQKILAGKLAIKDHLGESAVCTLPGRSCATAFQSPAPLAWHYSYGHWVEDQPAGTAGGGAATDPAGDGAFSSAGAFGFYPWIDATKTYYGIVARYALTSTAYLESAECGASVRRAFATGKGP